MSRGRCYPDVGAWPDPRKNAGRIVGVREIRVKEKSDRHTARERKKRRERERNLDKPEVCAGIVRERTHTVFS